MAAIFGESKFFWKIAKSTYLDSLGLKNFDKIALSRTVKEIKANLCFSIFGENSKWLPFLGRGNFLGKSRRVHYSDSLWVKNFDKIALSRTVKEIKPICVFPFLGKIQNGCHIWGEETFLKITKSTLLRYSVGRKCQRNHSISHGQGDRSKFMFLHFWQKFENSKWPPFLKSKMF